ncbi:hypothetical protein ANHS_2100 [Ligilactobacillus ruminis ATCC 25644]|nr:hypothetical protein ANHS_2100 [Ligilactobacillus ruminis ATCC 25644]
MYRVGKMLVREYAFTKSCPLVAESPAHPQTRQKSTRPHRASAFFLAIIEN